MVLFSARLLLVAISWCHWIGEALYYCTCERIRCVCVCVQWQTSTNTGCVCCSLLNKLTYSYHFQLSLISSVAFVSIVSMSQAVKYNNSSETSKSYILLEFKVEQRK